MDTDAQSRDVRIGPDRGARRVSGGCPKAAFVSALLAGVMIASAAAAETRIYTPADGLAHPEVYALAVVDDTVYAGTPNGLSWLGKGAARWRSARRNGGGPGDLITCLRPSGRTLWVGADTGLARFDTRNHKWTPLTAPDAVNQAAVSALLVDGAHLWVGCWRKGLYRLDLTSGAGAAVELPKVAVSGHGGPRARSVHALAAIGKQLFVGTERGLMVLDRKRNSWSWITTSDGLNTQMVTSLGVHGKTLWIGTAAGLARYDMITKKLDTWTASWGKGKNRKEAPTARGCPAAIGFILRIVVHGDKVLFSNFRGGGSGYFDTRTQTWHGLGIPGKAEISYTVAVQGKYLWAATPKMGRGVGLVRRELPWKP